MILKVAKANIKFISACNILFLHFHVNQLHVLCVNVIRKYNRNLMNLVFIK